MTFFLSLSFSVLSGCSDYKLQPHSDDAPPGQDTGDETQPPEDLPDCGGFSPPDPFEVAQNEDCLNEPQTGTFTPVIEWQYSQNSTYPQYNQIMAAPAVGNLNDDNGDGVVGEGDIPDVVFASFSGSSYRAPGTLTAISGDDGAVLWTVLAPGGEETYSCSGIAIGDLEGDGEIEVCASGVQHAVVCLEGETGALKWAAGSETNRYGCPAFADLEGDGQAEVIFGRQVFESDGTLRFTGTGGYGGPHAMSFAADWTGDGNQEVIAGASVYDLNGDIVWDDGFDAKTAVGDFNADGLPDLIRVQSGHVKLNLNDGAEVWSVTLPGGGNGGPPTVADFDGDGEPEVGVAGLSKYTVFETDGTTLWSNSVSDYSSSQTGSAVFDFEGDGSAEVVYSDELTLWVFEGSTGAILMEQTGHASGTLMEHPLIADVDNDGSTEIVMASNNYSKPGWTGITVIGDADNSWAPARPIWNQYSYHITNVNNDGSIPTVPQHNWLSWNNFRAGGTELGPGHWMPDLELADPEICTITCEQDLVTLYFPVLNGGLIEASTVRVSLKKEENGSFDLVRDDISWLLSPGTSEIMGPFQISRDEWGDNLWLQVDMQDDIQECNESNNLYSIGPWPCP